MSLGNMLKGSRCNPQDDEEKVRWYWWENEGKFAPYAWPGGYAIAYITSDSTAICSKCSNDSGHFDSDNNDGWRIVASEITSENDSCYYCDQCNKQLGAYCESNDKHSKFCANYFADV